MQVSNNENTKKRKNSLKVFWFNRSIPMVHLNNQDTLMRSEADDIIYKSIVSKKKINYKKLNMTKEGADKRKTELIQFRECLEKLKTIPLIKQRTIEWLDARQSRLTASDLGDAIKKNNSKIAKYKAGVVKNTTNFSTIPALKWGTMFEDMASRCYSQARNDIKIFEFGLIKDETNDHFGASPDGVSEMGIMLEIKCPYSRTIKDNYIPEKYYSQMQGQLAVCNLKECDYLECKFQTYDSIAEYIEDTEKNHRTVTNHGVIAEYKDCITNDFTYIYSDPYLGTDDAVKNIEKKVLENQTKTFIKYTPWILNSMNVQRVFFDENLWKETVPKINKFWELVEEYKLNPDKDGPEVKKSKKYIFINDDD
jgi:putative phage-type endonuclease